MTTIPLFFNTFNPKYIQQMKNMVLKEGGGGKFQDNIYF